MPQCKRDGCREVARPTGKRYCQYHYAEYILKQKSYQERERTAPKCNCGAPMFRENQTMCKECEEVAERQNRRDERLYKFWNSDLDQLKMLMYETGILNNYLNGE